MGGQPKGLLPAPDSGEPLVVRTCRLVRALGFTPCLVGKAKAYRPLLPELLHVADSPPNIGPLGGLLGLLHSAESGAVLALACDLPKLSEAVLARLASGDGVADVLAPRSETGLWEPLCTRYEARVARPLEFAIGAGVRSFQRLFEHLQVAELSLSEAERAALVDWDTPEDMKS